MTDGTAEGPEGTPRRFTMTDWTEAPRGARKAYPGDAA